MYANAPRPRWPARSINAAWSKEEKPYAAMLDALTRDLVETEATRVELDASARRPMADVLEEEEQLERTELDDAREELMSFRAALDDARNRSRGRNDVEVPFEDADPVQDARASLLIQYLVRTGYAEVRTEDPAPGRHVYYLRVDWDRLKPLAEPQGDLFKP
jgi:hypothetical protein